MTILDITGNRYSRLVAIRFSHTKQKKAFWIFKCDCGNEHVAPAFAVKRGDIQSCGCLRREVSKNLNFKHGQADETNQSRLYRIWAQMKRRCDLETVASYQRYGGRGIFVCKEWSDDYRNFEAWALSNGYSDTLTIDRINNDGNYEPGNCRWTTAKEQANNRRSSRIVIYENNSYTLSQLADSTGVDYKSLLYKLNKNITPEEAVRQLLNNKV